jgi:hypothetical protein
MLSLWKKFIVGGLKMNFLDFGGFLDITGMDFDAEGTRIKT